MGGAGTDTRLGDEGNDLLIGRQGNDVLDGGANALAGDTARFDLRWDQYAITAVTGGIRVAALRGGEGIDTVRRAGLVLLRRSPFRERTDTISIRLLRNCGWVRRLRSVSDERVGFLQIKQQRLLLLVFLSLVAISSNQLNYQTDHEQIVVGAGDILSYFAMSEAAPRLVAVPVPYHHAQRIFLPYLLGIASDVTGLSIPMTYLLGGSLLLGLAFWFFIRCCELLDLRQETIFIVSMAVAFNPYVFRHYFMFNGYINDIGFLAGLSASLFGLFAGRRGVMLAGILLASLNRQTTLVIMPAYVILEYALYRSHRWRINYIFTLSYFVLPVLIYIGTSFIAARTGLPSEMDMALLGLLYWMRSDFSVVRLLDFMIRGVIPFAFALALLMGCRLPVPRGRDRLLLAAGLLAMIAPICAQPFLGGPDWTLNSISRLNALAVFPAFLLVGMSIDQHMNRLSPQIASALGGLIVLGSVHHIYTFPGAFSAEKNIWFAAVHFAAAFVTAVVLWVSTRRDREPERAAARVDSW